MSAPKGSTSTPAQAGPAAGAAAGEDVQISVVSLAEPRPDPAKTADGGRVSVLGPRFRQRRC